MTLILIFFKKKKKILNNPKIKKIKIFQRKQTRPKNESIPYKFAKSTFNLKINFFLNIDKCTLSSISSKFFINSENGHLCAFCFEFCLKEKPSPDLLPSDDQNLVCSCPHEGFKFLLFHYILIS